MRRLLGIAVVVLGLCASQCTVTAYARPSSPPLTRTQVEKALRQTGLTALPNLGKPGRSEVMDYTFITKDSSPVFGAGMIIYVTTEAARRASVRYRHGAVTPRVITPASTTLRVRNVLLVFGPMPKTNKRVARALTTALSSLGKPTSP